MKKLRARETPWWNDSLAFVFPDIGVFEDTDPLFCRMALHLGTYTLNSYKMAPCRPYSSATCLSPSWASFLWLEQGPKVPQVRLSSLAPFLPPQSPNACIPFGDPFLEPPLHSPSLGYSSTSPGRHPCQSNRPAPFSLLLIPLFSALGCGQFGAWFTDSTTNSKYLMCVLYNATPRGTYTLCDVSFVHWVSMFVASFIQRICINSPLLGCVTCMQIILYLHHGVKWWPTLQWEKRGLLYSSVRVHKIESFQRTSDILMGTVYWKD